MLGCAVFAAALVATVVIHRQIPVPGAKQVSLAEALSGPGLTPLSESTECERILSSPPANQLKKYTEDGKYGTFEREVLSPVLLGVRCRPEQIKAYMEAGGWMLDLDLYRTGPNSFENNGYKRDYVMIFYKPDRGILSYLTGNKATGQTNFDFLVGKIIRITMVADIRFGG